MTTTKLYSIEGRGQTSHDDSWLSINDNYGHMQKVKVTYFES